MFSVFAVGCSSSSNPEPTRAISSVGPETTATQKPIPRETPSLAPRLTILAAASLTEVIPEIGEMFRQKYPNATLNYSFASSSILRTQLEQGARADLFASADDVQMNAAVKAGVIDGTPAQFVKNKLALIVPRNNPSKIATLNDLTKPGLKLVLAAPEVPVGNYARQSLAKMGQDVALGPAFADTVLKNLVSNEANVRAVVAKVALGEADAGFSYLSDVTSATALQLTIIQIPEQYNVVSNYYIAVVKDSREPKAARDFIDTITSEPAKQILKKYNFNTD